VRFGVFTTSRESKSKVKVKFVKNKRGCPTRPRQQKNLRTSPKIADGRRTISRYLEKFLEVGRSFFNLKNLSKKILGIFQSQDTSFQSIVSRLLSLELAIHLL
jgi:hypothetical protein